MNIRIDEIMASRSSLYLYYKKKKMRSKSSELVFLN